LTLGGVKEIKKGGIRNKAHVFLNSIRFMYKSALGYDKISHRADQQIVKDVLATDGGSVEHLILHAHSRGATGGALGYINELCAQALQSKAQRKAQNKQGPSRHQLKRLSLIIADPVSVMHMTDFATKEVSKLSLADRLRQIEHEFGIFIDLTVRYPHTVETDFLKANDQFKELAENYKEARVVYTGFSHDCGGAVLTTDLFFKITEPTPSLKEYKSDLSLSKEQQIQRLVDVLRPSLFEGGLPLSSESVAVTSLREDPFRHLLTHRNMDQLLIYERLGYVSKELVDDFQ